MASLKALAPAAGRYTGFPSPSTSEISFREHSVVRRTKLHVWGTSTSTYRADGTRLNTPVPCRSLHAWHHLWPSNIPCRRLWGRSCCLLLHLHHLRSQRRSCTQTVWSSCIFWPLNDIWCVTSSTATFTVPSNRLGDDWFNNLRILNTYKGKLESLQ